MISQVDFVPGDVIRVFQKVTEGERTRTQVFEGVVLSVRGRGDNKTFTVRKMVGEVGVEKIFPALSPSIEKVAVKAHLKTRVKKAKLYHLRHAKN